MTIMRDERPLTYPTVHDHHHAGRVAWWLQMPVRRESWGCVFERGPVAEPAGAVDSGSGRPESLGLPESGLDNTHSPTLVIPRDSRLQPFWRFVSASGIPAYAPVACDLTEAVERATESQGSTSPA